VAAVPLRQAIEEVASRDPVLAGLVARVGPVRHRPRDPDGPFGALARSIVFQQLAGRAAQAIYGRLRCAGSTSGRSTTSASARATGSPGESTRRRRPKELEPLGDRFRPYRSVVARYCWAAVPLLRAGATTEALR
jgi:3-methyladenine DNA glycosylase/8-oxoguanine DNA glycosylase